MDTEDYQQFVELTLKIKDLQSKRGYIEERIKGDMLETGVNKIQGDMATLQMVNRNTWVYSDECKEGIKSIQELEQKSGNAKQKASSYLRMILNT